MNIVLAIGDGMLLVSPCGLCGDAFAFNPKRVPSFTDADGAQHPLCPYCLGDVNADRATQGLAPFTPHRQAYSAIPAEEWPAPRAG